MELAKILITLSGSLLMVSFGINQMLHPEAWVNYIPEWFKKLSPQSPTGFMRTHALGNIAFGLLLLVGVLLFSGLIPIIAAWLALLWMLSIVPFAYARDWSIGVRDLSVTLALAALLALLYVK